MPVCPCLSLARILALYTVLDCCWRDGVLRVAFIGQADVDAAAIVLMGGIAAEAIVQGSAEGGLSDERSLQALLTAHHEQMRAAAVAARGSAAVAAEMEDLTLVEVRARARWAAANAVLLLREHRAAFEALREALAAGKTVGECVAVIEAAATPLAQNPDKKRD